MKFFVVLDEIQKNIWTMVKSQHLVIDILDFLHSINDNILSTIKGKEIIDKAERRMICLGLVKEVNPRFAKVTYIDKILYFFDQAYKEENPYDAFEEKKELTISEQKLLEVSKESFKLWQNYLISNNAIDRSQYLINNLNNFAKDPSLMKSKEINEIKSIEFHSSIHESFPEFCQLFSSSNLQPNNE